MLKELFSYMKQYKKYALDQPGLYRGGMYLRTDHSADYGGHGGCRNRKRGSGLYFA